MARLGAGSTCRCKGTATLTAPTRRIARRTPRLRALIRAAGCRSVGRAGHSAPIQCDPALIKPCPPPAPPQAAHPDRIGKRKGPRSSTARCVSGWRGTSALFSRPLTLRSLTIAPKAGLGFARRPTGCCAPAPAPGSSSNGWKRASRCRCAIKAAKRRRCSDADLASAKSRKRAGLHIPRTARGDTQPGPQVRCFTLDLPQGSCRHIG